MAWASSGRLGAVLAVVTTSFAARAEVSEVATARQLAIQGVDAVEGGDCRKGTELLERAEQLHHASVHLQYLARCRLRAGRLVSATEMWRRILRDGAPAGASPALARAVAEAQSELERTLPRLGSTTVKTASEYPELKLQLDGADLPVAVVDAAQVLDPGDHEIVARARGFAEWRHAFSLAEGEANIVTIEMVAVEGVAPGPDSGPAGEQTEGGTDPLVTAGWITASVGAAALVGGTVTLLMRNNRRSDLEEQCDGNACDRDDFPGKKLEDEKQAIRNLNTASNVLLFGGGALLAGGVTLIVVGGSKGSGEANSALLGGAAGAEAGLTFRGRW